MWKPEKSSPFSKVITSGRCYIMLVSTFLVLSTKTEEKILTSHYSLTILYYICHYLIPTVILFLIFIKI